MVLPILISVMPMEAMMLFNVSPDSPEELEDNSARTKSPASLVPSTVHYIRSFTNGHVIMKISVLSLMYAVNNQLTFICLTLMSPAFFNMFKSGTAFLSALLMLVLLNQRLPTRQWLSLSLQCLGLIVAQYNPCTQSARLHLLAYVVILIGVTISALCGVWNAHIIKSLGIPLHGVNLILYALGTVLNLMFYFATKYFPHLYKQDHPVDHFFQGFNPSVLLVVICNSLLGLAISIVYKYADAIVKTLAASANTVIWMVFLGPIFFGNAVDAPMLLGCLTVSIATYLYLSTGPEQKAAARAPAKDEKELLPLNASPTDVSHADGMSKNEHDVLPSTAPQVLPLLLLLLASLLSSVAFNHASIRRSLSEPNALGNGGLLLQAQPKLSPLYGDRAILQGRVAVVLIGPVAENLGEVLRSIDRELLPSLCSSPTSIDLFVSLTHLSPELRLLIDESDLSVQPHFVSLPSTELQQSCGDIDVTSLAAAQVNAFERSREAALGIDGAKQSAGRTQLLYQWFVLLRLEAPLVEPVPPLALLDWSSITIADGSSLANARLLFVPAPLAGTFAAAHHLFSESVCHLLTSERELWKRAETPSIRMISGRFHDSDMSGQTLLLDGCSDLPTEVEREACRRILQPLPKSH